MASFERYGQGDPIPHARHMLTHRQHRRFYRLSAVTEISPMIGEISLTDRTGDMIVKALKDYMGNVSLTNNGTYLSPTLKRVLVYPFNSPKKFEDWNAFLGTFIIASIWLPKRIRYTS